MILFKLSLYNVQYCVDLHRSEVEEMSNSSSEEDVKPIKLKFRDLHTIDVKSAEFRDLPADMRHDILTELKETRKQNSWGRIHELPEVRTNQAAILYSALVETWKSRYCSTFSHILGYGIEKV